jgi:hypothetical protein
MKMETTFPVERLNGKSRVMADCPTDLPSEKGG